MRARKFFLLFLFAGLISWPTFSEAGQGCCSWHGGQSYCDTSVGRWVCSDGTYSPSCGCTFIPPKATTKTQPPAKKVVATPTEPKEDPKQKEIDDLKKQNSDLNSKLKEAEDHFIDSYQHSKDLDKSIVIWITSLLILFASLYYNATENNETAGVIFGWTFFGLFIYLIATSFSSLLTILGAYKDFLF
jgi:hypothetical protein